MLKIVEFEPTFLKVTKKANIENGICFFIRPEKPLIPYFPTIRKSGRGEK